MSVESRRPGVLAVHSLDHFAITVPDLDVARDFYTNFGLEVREAEDGLDLYSFGHPHRWARLTKGGRKALRHVSFGVFDDDLDRFAAHFARLGIAAAEGGDPAVRSLWLTDPHGVPLEIRVAGKSSPSAKGAAATPAAGLRGAPMRDQAPTVRPRRMSHALFFTPDMDTTLDFYIHVLGLRLSDRSGPAAFLHSAHGSDHHLVAFGEAAGTGYHHSAWDVGSVDEVGLGAAQMARAGHVVGWGLGRHVLGSNYFHYVRDPWGSYAEYSFDIDYVPADLDWPSMHAPPENSMSLWGPPVPAGFGTNHEEDAR
ncbi:VOC family protein [Niveispirillum sp. KHB5.9]|uniref:VOC family protein n=1 Tax=Niveispirillum sp. KHB5.9 TaxID=3400269 RepID=UPI003A896849